MGASQGLTKSTAAGSRPASPRVRPVAPATVSPTPAPRRSCHRPPARRHPDQPSTGGEVVPMCTSVSPSTRRSNRAARRPSTASSAASSASMANTMSHSSNTSSWTHCDPRAQRAKFGVLAGVRFHTVSGTPARTRFTAIGSPIRPAPQSQDAPPRPLLMMKSSPSSYNRHSTRPFHCDAL